MSPCSTTRLLLLLTLNSAPFFPSIDVTGTEQLTSLTKMVAEIAQDNTTHNGTQQGHNLGHTFVHVVATCFLSIILVAVTCNIVLIATISLTPRLHSKMHVYIVNLALSDLITALGAIPFDVEYMLRGHFAFGEILCGIMHVTFLISLPASVLCLSLLTIERLIAVVYPYRVDVIITRRRVVMSVTLMWVYVLMVGFFPLMYDHEAHFIHNRNCFLTFPLGYHMFQVIVNFLIPTLIICGINFILFRISHRHATRIALQGRVIRRASRTEKVSWNALRSCLSRNMKLMHNMKAIKRIAMLLGVFLVCWLSYIIIAATNYVCQCVSREVTWVANIINYSSTAINPLLYGLTNKSIHKELGKRLSLYLRNYFPGLYDQDRRKELSAELMSRRVCDQLAVMPKRADSPPNNRSRKFGINDVTLMFRRRGSAVADMNIASNHNL